MTNREAKALADRVIKLYGPVIDLRKNPEIIIDILRRFDEIPDGGTPCGGVPNPPPPPPDSRAADPITNEEILKAVLRLSRDVSAIKSTVAKLGARKR